LQFINHRVSETLVGDGVEVVVEIFEGKKFIIERINVAGNNVTNDDVIRGEMIVDEGDPYSAILINKSVNRLKSRGIFSEVEHTILDGSSPDLKILEIKVVEKATGEIMAGAGVGTDGTTVMASVSENNWLGRGVKLQSTVNLSAEKISGNLAVTVPNYNYSGNSVYGSLDVSSDDRTVSSGYKSNKTGWALGTEFEQYENIYLSPSISITHEKIESQSTASEAIKKMDGTFNNADFGYGITIDKRNQTYLPTAGYQTKILQSIPIIQDSSSLLNGLTHTHYYAFSDDLIGAFKFFGRSIHGMDKDVRLTSRLRIPQTRLRGFNTSRVGPKDGPDWIGGNYVTAMGFEAQLPNLLPESTKTDISAFIDTGNVWAIDYDSTLDDSSKFRSSFGLAADINTVVGPLSFTIAQSITKANTDETETFNFRLGTSF
jgi:outer membrane protein insertion porin family